MVNEASKFNDIFSELIVGGNGLVLKGEPIVLPEALHMKDIKLAHKCMSWSECINKKTVKSFLLP